MKKELWVLFFLFLAAISVFSEVVQTFVEVFGERLKHIILELNPIYAKALLMLFFGVITMAITPLVKKVNKYIHTIQKQVYYLPWSLEAKQQLQKVKDALASADHNLALRLLYDFNAPLLKDRLTLLSSQVAKYNADGIAGVQSTDEKSVAFNKITKEIFSLTDDIGRGFLEKEAQNQKIRERFRERYLEYLKQKLASRRPVKLRKWVSKEGTNDLIASAFVTYPNDGIPGDIGKIFQDAHGRLLIVGQPGMGKTSLLLELADRLFDLEPDALPVLINLASWKSGFIKLERWLEEVLVSELDTNKSGVKAVLEQSRLILLLDGLDELREEGEMRSCLAAITEYGITAGKSYVISCRIKDYLKVQESARVNMQIEVGSLSADELIVELEQSGYEQPEAQVLAQALRKNPLLCQVAETPFYFNTLQLIYAGATPDFISQEPSTLRSEIKQCFIQYALRQDKDKSFTPEAVAHWLSFLANRMTERSKVVFELSDLQYDWQKGTRSERIVAGLIAGLVYGLVIGLVYGLLYGVLFGLILGLVVGLIFGLVVGLVRGLREDSKNWPEITTKDFITWSIYVFFEYIKVFWVVIITSLLVRGLTYGLVGGLVFGFVSGSVGGLEIGLVFGLVMGLVFGLVRGLVMGLIIFIEEESRSFTEINKPYQRFYGSMRQLHFSILQHWHLRYLLYKKGLLPWHLVDFLNEMKERHLLESNGASWRFRHRIIQEYFAERWTG